MTNWIVLLIGECFPFAKGHEFGTVGRYERLVGRVHFAVDLGAPAERGITDLDNRRSMTRAAFVSSAIFQS
jgi:hypothetical protein